MPAGEDKTCVAAVAWLMYPLRLCYDRRRAQWQAAGAAEATGGCVMLFERECNQQQRTQPPAACGWCRECIASARCAVPLVLL